MILHLIVRSVCLFMLAMVVIKQIVEYRAFINGEKDLRLKLLGSTLAFFMLALATTVYQLQLMYGGGYVDNKMIYMIVTVALAVGTFTWFYIYFVRK